MRSPARTWVLALVVASGCGDTTDATVGRGRGARGPAAATASPQAADDAPVPFGEAPAADRERARARPRRPDPGPRRAPGRAAGGGAGATGLGEAPDGESEDVRDLLRRAFGTPTACLSEQTRDALDDRLTVTVTARVMPSGRVLDAEVSSSALSEADRACMRRHARGLRLRSGLEGTPRAVTASIEYTVQDDRVSRTEREAPPRDLHPGTLAPDRTLPAAGTAEGRPPGSVTPDLTLPAQGSDERPPGFVPPSSTLPARGP